MLPDIDVSPNPVDFGVTPIGRSKNSPITIKNIGIGPLVIDSLKFDGINANLFSISDTLESPLTVQAGDSAMVEIGFLPDSEGNKNASLRIYSNDPDEPTFIVTLNARGINAPTTIITISNAVRNQDAIVNAAASSDTTIRSVIIRYGASNVPGFPETRILDSQGGGNFTGTIPGASVTELGLKVLLEVTDDFQIITNDTIFPPVQIPAGTLTHTFDDNLVNRWQMFSLPFLPDTIPDRALQTVLNDLGEEDDFKWRIWRTDDTGDSSNYLAITLLDGMGEFGRFESGNAFWLYVRDDANGSVDSRTIGFPNMSTVPADAFTDTLQPGWNQIGSPYSFVMDWDRVVSPQKDSLQVFQYNGTGFDGPLSKKRLGWTPLINTNFDLNPYDGFAVLNPTSQAISITFLPQSTAASVAKFAAGESLNKTNWQIQLIAETDRTFDANIIGMNQFANVTKDHLDFVNPPVVGVDFINLYFDHSDWLQDQKHYSADFRPHNLEGDIWYFTLSSANRSVDFYIRDFAELPQNFHTLLIDTKYQREYLLTNSEKVTLRDIGPGETNRFVLLIGTEEFINNRAAGVELMEVAEYRLLPNYPNPFNPETFIRYQVPAAGDVSLKIYNILGQEIATLVDGIKEAGFYEIRWDGKTQNGTEAASGVYVFTLKANNFTQSLKMIKLK